MARPKKENAEYFSHDANMRNDPKVKALRKKFTEGYAVYNMFLEYLTDCALFEVEMSELEFEILSGDFDVEVEILKDILDYCAKVGLLIKSENVFFSSGLKKRLQPVLDKRNNAKDKFLQIKLQENEQKVQKSGVSVAETTQSKVKERKVKESKVKEGLGSSDFSNPPPPMKIDFQKLIDFFNDNRGSMPEIKIISKPRESRISNLIKLHSKEKLIEVIENCKNSNFIQGENDRNWIADFDWITKPANFIKILEGNFKNKNNGKSTAGILKQNRNR